MMERERGTLVKWYVEVEVQYSTVVEMYGGEGKRQVRYGCKIGKRKKLWKIIGIWHQLAS